MATIPRSLLNNSRPLLTLPSSQPKAVKGEKEGYSTAVMHLAPYDLAQRGNVCAHATVECAELCLGRAGRGGILSGSLDDIRARHTNAIQLARIARTDRFFDDSAGFIADLASEIYRHVKAARRTGMKPAVRLNGTSDIPWERVAPQLFAWFKDVVFYDYTKYPVDKRPQEKLPSNYSLTMSYSGHNADACLHALEQGRNVAMVYGIKRGQPLPSHFGMFPVIDGDVNDLRFLDPRPCIVGLRFKGHRIPTDSPFVIRAPFTSVEAD